MARRILKIVNRSTRPASTGEPAIQAMTEAIAIQFRVDYFVERHDLTLFSDADYRRAFSRAGLRVDVIAGDFSDRYVGVKAQ